MTGLLGIPSPQPELTGGRGTVRPGAVTRRPANGLAATLRTTAPSVAPVSSTLADGLTYVRDPIDPSVTTRDLVLMADTGGTSSTIKYWYLPWSP